MSTFQFSTFNVTPLGRRALEDIISNICRQLDSLGHKSYWCDEAFSLETDTYVVVFEGFLPPHIEFLRACRQDGAKIIIVGTEAPGAHGFNSGLTPELLLRQKLFPAAAHEAAAIWYTVPDSGRWYGTFGPPAAYLELGYAPASVRHPAAQLDHDFGFFGSMTRRRWKLLQKFARASIGSRKATVRYAELIAGEERDAQMARARVMLQIRAHEKMQNLSTSRLCTAMHIGRPVIAEMHEDPGVWGRIIEFAHPAKFIDQAIDMSKRWQEAYEEQFARFKTLLPPEKCVGRAIEQTL